MKLSKKKYQEIVDRGCGGYRDYWGEFDCEHPYNWTCEECPVCIEIQKANNVRPDAPVNFCDSNELILDSNLDS